MDVGLEFDRLENGYTGNISRWVPYYRELVHCLVDRLPAGFSPRRILDLGCGNGNVAGLLLGRFPDAAYLLVDASAEMIGACRRRFAGQPQVEFRQAFFQELDLPAGSFDLIVAGLSLHHLDGQEKQILFRRLFDWLTPGGCFTCADLFVDKNEEPGHGRVIADWQREAAARGTTPEEWQYLMDHYDRYDRPDSFSNQLGWLRQAGFHRVSIPWKLGAWGALLAIK